MGLQMFARLAFAIVAMFSAERAAAEAWAFEENKDPITDATRGVATLTGPDGVLAVKCDRNGVNVVYVHIVSAKHIGVLRNNFRNVIIRLDDGSAVARSMSHDENGAIYQAGNPGTPMLAANLGSARKIAIRLTNYSGDIVDMMFASDGSDEAVRKAFATCGQSYPEPNQPNQLTQSRR